MSDAGPGGDSPLRQGTPVATSGAETKPPSVKRPSAGPPDQPDAAAARTEWRAARPSLAATQPRSSARSSAGRRLNCCKWHNVHSEASTPCLFLAIQPRHSIPRRLRLPAAFAAGSPPRPPAGVLGHNAKRKELVPEVAARPSAGGHGAWPQSVGTGHTLHPPAPCGANMAVSNRVGGGSGLKSLARNTHAPAAPEASMSSQSTDPGESADQSTYQSADPGAQERAVPGQSIP